MWHWASSYKLEEQRRHFIFWFVYVWNEKTSEPRCSKDCKESKTNRPKWTTQYRYVCKTVSMYTNLPQSDFGPLCFHPCHAHFPMLTSPDTIFPSCPIVLLPPLFLFILCLSVRITRQCCIIVQILIDIVMWGAISFSHYEIVVLI